MEMARSSARQADSEQQLPLKRAWTKPAPEAPARRVMCAGCREREARYGFQDNHDDPALDRPSTLSFQCFRIEITRRQAVAARIARGWNAQQASLPLHDTLRSLTQRRRRAQIAARKAVGE